MTRCDACVAVCVRFPYTVLVNNSNRKIKMGSMTVLLSVFAVLMMVTYAAAGSCPLPSKVYGCTPKCVQDRDCKNGMLCCPNGCNTKSCTDTTQYGGAGGGNDRFSQSGGTGVYCGNAKCSPGEVCKQDSATRRMKCSRP